MRRKGTKGMRSVKLLVVTAFAAGLVGGTAATSLADSPYTVNMTLHTHKGIEFDPGFLVDASPCFVTTADVTEVFNGEFHVLAAGIDDQGNLVPPLHFEKTVEESLLIVPDDPTLPTYSGHPTAHVSNFENSPTRSSCDSLIASKLTPGVSATGFGRCSQRKTVSAARGSVTARSRKPARSLRRKAACGHAGLRGRA
jgi:hypothetical protein